MIGLILGAVIVLAVYFVFVRPTLPPAWRTPGSAPLYIAGATGAVLLLVSMVFVLVKRTGRGGPPQAWFVAHG